MTGRGRQHSNIPTSQLGWLAVFFVLSTASALAADKIVVVTVTEGFRHDSIPTAERFIADLAPRLGFEVTFLRQESDLDGGLSPAALRDVKAVMFVNTTCDLPVPSR